MGKMGDTWRGVETSTKAGETDQGMTINSDMRTKYTVNNTWHEEPVRFNVKRSMDENPTSIVNSYCVSLKNPQISELKIERT
jgi:hypothetical protein